jgi:hypothetical protein
MNLHHVVIKSPTGIPDDASVTIDGNQIKGLVEVGFSIRADSMAEIRLTLIGGIEADMEQMVERVLESPPKEPA